jgi:hypothetical protein
MLRLWCSIALALTLLVTGLGVQARPAAAAAMQSGTPAAEETPEADAEEPAPDDASESASSEDMSLSDGFPAVLAQGATYVSGDTLVWSVTEIDAPELDDAESESGNSALFLGTEGAMVIRNDVTGKRAQIEAGEGFFRAPDDAYTISAVGASASYWAFELGSAEDVSLDAFYEGPKVEGIDEGVYDLEMTRFTLLPGEAADLPEHNGTGLTMVLSGEIEVRGDRVASLREGEGQTLLPDSGDAEVTNSGSQPAMYVFVSLGEAISDDTAGAGTASQPQATAEPEDPQETPDTDPGVEETPDTSGDTGAGTSVSVTALADIYVTVVVDGTVAYDGNLAAGQSTGPIAGTSFEVTTSSGANTQFANACGDTFFMGYEEGEATYFLTAEPDC